MILWSEGNNLTQISPGQGSKVTVLPGKVGVPLWSVLPDTQCTKKKLWTKSLAIWRKPQVSSKMHQK